MIGEDHFTYNRNKSGPGIEPCGSPYFNVSASEKHYQYKPKTFCLKDRTLTI